MIHDNQDAVDDNNDHGDNNDHHNHNFDHDHQWRPQWSLWPWVWSSPTIMIDHADHDQDHFGKHGDHYDHHSGQPTSYKRLLLNSTSKHRQWHRSLKNLSNTLPQWGGDFAKSKVEIVEISENKKEKSKVEMCRWCWTMSSSTGCISSLTPPGT